jgi:hypothetical protein
MANVDKRSRSLRSGGKRQAAAKQAGKKYRGTSKFKNAEIRAAVDSQAHILYTVSANTLSRIVQLDSFSFTD